MVCRTSFLVVFLCFVSTHSVFADEAPRALENRGCEKEGAYCVYYSGDEALYQGICQRGQCTRPVVKKKTVQAVLEKWRKALQKTANGKKTHFAQLYAKTSVAPKRDSRDILKNRYRWVRLQLQNIQVLERRGLTFSVKFAQLTITPKYKKKTCKMIEFGWYPRTLTDKDRAMLRKDNPIRAYTSQWKINVERECHQKMLSHRQARTLVERWRQAYIRLARGRLEDFSYYLRFYDKKYRTSQYKLLYRRFLSAKTTRSVPNDFYFLGQRVTFSDKETFKTRFFHNDSLKTLTWKRSIRNIRLYNKTKTKGTNHVKRLVKRVKMYDWRIVKETWANTAYGVGVTAELRRYRLPNVDVCRKTKRKDGQKCEYAYGVSEYPGVCRGGDCTRPVVKKKTTKQLLESWRKAWEQTAGGKTKNVEAFAKLYVMSKKRRAHFLKVKTYLGKRRKWIRVRLRDVNVLERQGTSFAVRFVQQYRAPKYKDTSCKELDWRWNPKKPLKWDIISETQCGEKKLSSHKARRLVRLWRSAWQKLTKGRSADVQALRTFYCKSYLASKAAVFSGQLKEVKKYPWMRLRLGGVSVDLKSAKTFSTRFLMVQKAPGVRMIGVKTLSWKRKKQEGKEAYGWCIVEETFQQRGKRARKRKVKGAFLVPPTSNTPKKIAMSPPADVPTPPVQWAADPTYTPAPYKARLDVAVGACLLLLFWLGGLLLFKRRRRAQLA